jgi:hypothetical protein
MGERHPVPLNQNFDSLSVGGNLMSHNITKIVEVLDVEEQTKSIHPAYYIKRTRYLCRI